MPSINLGEKRNRKQITNKMDDLGLEANTEILRNTAGSAKSLKCESLLL